MAKPFSVHNSFSAREVTVRLGSSRHESGGQLVQATKLTGHPDYDSNTIDFDVSIITLAENVPDSDASQTVAPADSEPAADTSVIISGWGTLTVSLNNSYTRNFT